MGINIPILKNIFKKSATDEEQLQQEPQDMLAYFSKEDIFTISSKEEFEKKYSIIHNTLERSIQEYLTQSDLFLIEEKRTKKRILIVPDLNKLHFKNVFNTLDFDEIKYIDEQGLNLLLNKSVKSVKKIEESSLEFVFDILKKARVSGASDIYLHLRDITFTVEFRTSLGIEKIGEWGIKEAQQVRHTLEYLSNEEANTKWFDKKITYEKNEYRINFFETVSGYDCTIRSYADTVQGELTLENLGYTKRVRDVIEDICLNQNGMILYTAQTGQGKTTSQYANLLWLSTKKNLRVVTVENPVEKKFSSMAQIDLSEYQSAEDRYRMTGKDALKLFLRARPDVINMGEIRDEEEAQLAYTASITGHLVFGTLHTNSVYTAIKRLEKTGLSEDDIKATVKGIIYQILTRQLCPHCKILVEEGKDENGNKYMHYKANSKGCEECKCGYAHLRTPLVEIGQFNPTKDYDFDDPNTYEKYISLQDSAKEKYDLGIIDKLHYEAIIHGKREPKLACEEG